MLDNKGFDLWSDGYDESVNASCEQNTYPFAGYNKVLDYIFKVVLEKKNAVVLDVGFGTGTLTQRLYDSGCIVYGQDFSLGMIEIAQQKMPAAKLFMGDFTHGIVKPLLVNHYDYIVSTYAMHHLLDEQKIALMHSLDRLLKPGGKILIGDVAFETNEEMEQCRKSAGDEWDNDEHYFVANTIKRTFPSLAFVQISHCAGVLILKHTDN